jgi:hypothetical protein
LKRNMYVIERNEDDKIEEKKESKERRKEGTS